MSLLEHFHVFETLLYGFALAHILVGVSRMIRNKTKIYWLHMVAVVGFALTILVRYFYLIGDNHFAHLTDGYQFLFLDFLPLSCLFIISYLLFPDAHENVPLKPFFWNHAYTICLLASIFSSLAAIRNLQGFALSGELDFTSPLVFLAVVITGVFSVLCFYAFIFKNKNTVKVTIVLILLFNAFLMVTAKLEVF